MDNQHGTPTDAELGWLAGIIDGEGTIAFSVYELRHRERRLQDVRVKPQIIVCGTDQALIKAAAEIMHKIGAGAHVQERVPRYPGFAHKVCKTAWALNVSGFKRVRTLLPAVTPHLRSIKKTKAQLVLRYIDQRFAKRADNSRMPLELDDLLLIREIIEFSAIHNAKGPPARNLDKIERLVRDYTRDAGRTPDDDIVRPVVRATEDRSRDPAPVGSVGQ